MASSQSESHEEIPVQISLEEKAHLDEIIKQAECLLEPPEFSSQALAIVASNESLDRDAAAKLGIIMLAGALKNQTKGPLEVMESYKYAGYFVKNFPSPIVSIGTFAMGSLTTKGVKAAVVFSGKNKAGVDCGWLLALAHTKATGRKVYVECGCKDKFININWAEVENNLDTKGGLLAMASDTETGTSVFATIAGTGGKSFVAAWFRG